MMKKKAILITLVFVALPILLLGCRSKTTATPTTNPDLIYTAAAQTADVRLTQIFQSTPSATPVPPTPTNDPTQTAAAQTASAILTQTAAASLTPQGTATNTALPTVPGGISGDRSVYVSDVTIPDGTVLAPGATFRKTWKVQNAGTTTWTTAYTFVFISGDPMGTVTSVPLSQLVSPGQQVEISVDMVAPTTNGTYKGFWKMKNGAGQLFNDSVYVLIAVGSGGAAPTATQGGTPGPTATSHPNPSPTSTGIPGDPISNMSMSVDEGTYLGQCPHTFTFAATFTVNQSSTLTYNLDANSDTPGFSFNLPGAQTSTFGPGTYSLTFPLTFTSSGTGWVRFHVTAPVDITSNQASFNLTCTP
jgi:hypothetical protein